MLVDVSPGERRWRWEPNAQPSEMSNETCSDGPGDARGIAKTKMSRLLDGKHLKAMGTAAKEKVITSRARERVPKNIKWEFLPNLLKLLVKGKEFIRRGSGFPGEKF